MGLTPLLTVIVIDPPYETLLPALGLQLRTVPTVGFCQEYGREETVSWIFLLLHQLCASDSVEKFGTE